MSDDPKSCDNEPWVREATAEWLQRWTSDGGDLAARLKGRAQFLRDRGEVKSPELMEEAAVAIATHSPDTLERREAIARALRVAKERADKEFGVAWQHLEEISRFELFAAALSLPAREVSGERAREVFAAGFHAAEKALGFEGCDESEDALAIEWGEYSATLATTPAPREMEADLAEAVNALERIKSGRSSVTECATIAAATPALALTAAALRAHAAQKEG